MVFPGVPGLLAGHWIVRNTWGRTEDWFSLAQRRRQVWTQGIHWKSELALLNPQQTSFTHRKADLVLNWERSHSKKRAGS